MLESHFCLLEETFDRKWLNEQSDGHRLRDLWWRDDTLASIELVTVADSIRLMNEIDSSWVKGLVKDIKQNPSNCHGYIFELVGTAMLARGGMKVRPMPKNFPAYDIAVCFPDGFELLVSLKNHDISKFEMEFRQNCDEIRAIAAAKLRGNVHSFCMSAISRTYINQTRMTGLKKLIAQIPTIPEAGIQLPYPDVRVNLSRPLKGFDGMALDPRYYSDTLQILCSQHPNEQRNFYSKVMEAEEKFHKIFKPDLTKQARIVMMRLHPTADINFLQAAAQRMLEENPDLQVDGFYFYQPAVVHDDQSTVICHHLQQAISMRYPLGRLIRSAPLFGTISTKPTELRLRGKGIDQLLEGSLMYQRADHFVAAKLEADGSLFGEIKNPASGIHVHRVFELNGQRMVFGGKAPGHDKLRVL